MTMQRVRSLHPATNGTVPRSPSGSSCLRDAGADNAGCDEREVDLRDGSTMRIRLLRPDDAGALLDLHRSLSRSNLFFRFLTPMPTVHESFIAPLTRVDQNRNLGLVGEVDGRLVAAAHCFRDENDARRGEIAFVTHESLQGRGIATWMLKHLAQAAWKHDIHILDGMVHHENYRMIDVLTQSGFAAESHRRGSECYISLQLTAPV